MMEKNALHIWPRGAYMMIALPNPDGTFTCTLFLSIEGSPSFNELQTPEAVIQFFEKEFPDALALMPTLVEDFFGNPTSSLVTVRCYPWVVADKVALLGDAAHAVVPFFGQGMNCSFEDCVVMDECMETYLPNWTQVFDQYQKLRKPNADAIASLAVQNFYEMSDKVGDAEFLHRKHIEHDLCELYPDIFQSQYELVTFSQIPYLKAQQRGPINDQILSSIIEQKLEDKIKDRSIIEPVIRKFADYL
jgi:kynurenine 3-monooxygenase